MSTTITASNLPQALQWSAPGNHPAANRPVSAKGSNRPASAKGSSSNVRDARLRSYEEIHKESLATIKQGAVIAKRMQAELKRREAEFEARQQKRDQKFAEFEARYVLSVSVNVFVSIPFFVHPF